QLEYLMQEIIWRSLDIDNKQGRTLTIGADGRVLRATLATVTSTDRWVITPHYVQEINRTVAVAKEHAKLRNQLAHGSWQHPPGQPSKIRMHFMKERGD